MSADFTPEKEDYKILAPFKMQVLTNFPYIEADFDALTNYQLLCKVVEYLNNVIANENEVTEQITSLYNAYVSLQNYVNDYFNNLDVQEEIDNKLDKMITDGDFDTIFNRFISENPTLIPNEVLSYLNTNAQTLINNKIDDMIDNDEFQPIVKPYVDDYMVDTVMPAINLQNQTIDSRMDAQDTLIQAAASGSPLVASSTSGMTDTSKVYVNTTDGNWYYYDGDSWEIGGVYQATGVSESDPIIEKIVDSVYALYPIDEVDALKELYIIDPNTDLTNFKLNGIVKGYGNDYWIRFENSAGTAFVASSSPYSSLALVPDVIPIYAEGTKNIVAYAVVDWTIIDNGTYATYHKIPNERTKYLKSSPIIYDYLNFTNVSNELSNVNSIPKLNTITDGSYDNKDINNLEGTSYVSSNTDYIWFAYPVNRIKLFDTIVFKAKTGTTNFYKITYEEGATSLTYELLTSVDNIIDLEYKTIKFDNPINLADNQFIGVNGSFYYGTSTTYKARNYNISSGAVGTLSGQVLSFTAFNSKSLTNEVENIINKIDNSRYGEVILYNKKLDSQNNDLIGTTSFDTYGLVVGSSKNALNKSYSVADRTMSYVCKFNSGSVAVFGTGYPVPGDYNLNSNVTINITNKTVNINGVKSAICGLLNTTDEYIISITKHYQNIIVNIKDIYTGEDFEMIATFNGTGGVGDGAVPGEVTFNTGMWNGYPAFYDTGNGFKISKIIITCAKCDVLAYGDSITEPEAYWPKNIFNKSWTQLCREKMNNRFVSDGRSGTSYAAIMQRIYDELPLIKPKYCMITIGTNSTATVEQLTTLVQYIKSLDIIPILNHIPCYNNNGNTTGFITANSYIDTVRQNENIKGANFDICTSLDHDGLVLDETTMWLEDYSTSTYYHHPNVKGSSLMFDQLLIDVPEIFE